MAPPDPPRPPVLLVTRDATLRGDLLRLAAAAGVAAQVVAEPQDALRAWGSAALVILGADLVADIAPHRPARRGEVHVVGPGPLDDRVFRGAMAAGAQDVIELPAGEQWLAQTLGDTADGAWSAALTIGVLPGSGGAGASTLAAALGQVSARVGPAVLVDLDAWGPGLGRLLGFEELPGSRWDALQQSSGRLGSRDLREALPTREGLALLGFGVGPAREPQTALLREVIAAAQRGTDVLVLDLPRSVVGAAHEGQEASTVMDSLDLLVLLVHGTVSGVASAARVAARLTGEHPPAGVVVRTSSGAVDPRRVATALELTLLADYPSRRRVVEGVDLGLGPVRSLRSPLARAARDVLAEARMRAGARSW